MPAARSRRATSLALPIRAARWRGAHLVGEHQSRGELTGQALPLASAHPMLESPPPGSTPFHHASSHTVTDAPCRAVGSVDLNAWGRQEHFNNARVALAACLRARSGGGPSGFGDTHLYYGNCRWWSTSRIHTHSSTQRHT